MRVRVTDMRPRRTGDGPTSDADLDLRTKRFVTVSEIETGGGDLVIRREDGQCLSIRPKDDGFEVRHFADDDATETYFSHKFQVHSGFPPPPEVTE